jgi:hypothetical protein
MARRQLPKQIRFEVFKRDKFTCQYCGRSAPEVILEVDHIKPVSKGGKNDILNLITACRDCNRGKTNKEISDDSAVKIQKQQLDLMQERREQLEMMLKWREMLDQEMEIEIDAINALLSRRTKWELSDHGRNSTRKYINQFGFDEVYKAADLAITKYYDGSEPSWQNAFRKIGGICYNWKKARNGDA